MTDAEKHGYVARTVADLLRIPVGDPAPTLDNDQDVEEWTKTAAGLTNMRDLDEVFRFNNLPLRFESKLVKIRKLWNFILLQV